MAMFVGILGTIALLLSTVGPKSGCEWHLAPGATPASILNLIVLRGTRLVAIGAALGCAGAFAGVRYVRSYLFGIEATDPLTWLAVSALLVTVGLVACAIPARRAMRIDPAVALRNS